MMNIFKKTKLIRGKIVPARHFTIHALFYFIVFVAAPILVLTFLLDLLGWVLATVIFDASCYGVACFF
ncbi:MAG: hypothetical protein P8J85_07465 [Alphaproteobacteria bacterium]|nr:hypothetical protein [Alphaproteobacteria bacterium]MDG1887026.1 hypothetical protein [Alphaproteobacteria bacterium]